MNKIAISILVAALIVGNVFYVSFKEVNAHQEYLRAAAIAADYRADPQSVISARVDIQKGSDFTPMWKREQHIRVPEAVEAPHTVETIAKEVSSEVEDIEVVAQGDKVAEVVAPVPDLIPESWPQQAPKKTEEPASSPVAAHILRLLNNIRADAGLVPFSVDTGLAQIAAGHSDDMARNDYLSHTALDGCSYTCRVERSGYRAVAWAENIGFIEKSHLLDSPQEIAEYMVESWMGSDTHRVNILNSSYTHIGLGVAHSGSDIYMTTDFALPQ